MPKFQAAATPRRSVSQMPIQELNDGAGETEESIEQSQESTAPANVAQRGDLAAVHEAASRLIDELGQVSDGDQVSEIVANALKLLRDQTNRGDIKLINKSFKELRYALKVFAPYRDVRKV